MPQFSRPVYEGLPWLYIICGLLTLGGSYLLAAHGVLSLLVGIVGLLLLLLRRRGAAAAARLPRAALAVR